ncbi:MAG: hypothetical protein Q4A52_06530 [Bacillota bacterium]|nr:hypothetical protein [Bacillota bacterium]
MSIMSSRIVRHKIVVDEFKKMGAKVYEIQGVQVLVKFKLGDFKISYAYHINEDNTYFLERVKPYVLSIGDFEFEEQIVDVIREDIKQFQNAMRSSNFKSFITIDNHLTQLVRVFEDLYLYYNLSKEDIQLLDRGVDRLLDEMKAIMRRSTRAYTDKEPEILKLDMKFLDESENEK